MHINLAANIFSRVDTKFSDHRKIGRKNEKLIVRRQRKNHFFLYFASALPLLRFFSAILFCLMFHWIYKDLLTEKLLSIVKQVDMIFVTCIPCTVYYWKEKLNNDNNRNANGHLWMLNGFWIESIM